MDFSFSSRSSFSAIFCWTSSDAPSSFGAGILSDIFNGGRLTRSNDIQHLRFDEVNVSITRRMNVVVAYIAAVGKAVVSADLLKTIAKSIPVGVGNITFLSETAALIAIAMQKILPKKLST